MQFAKQRGSPEVSVAALILASEAGILDVGERAAPMAGDNTKAEAGAMPQDGADGHEDELVAVALQGEGSGECVRIQPGSPEWREQLVRLPCERVLQRYVDLIGNGLVVEPTPEALAAAHELTPAVLRILQFIVAMRPARFEQHLHWFFPFLTQLVHSWEHSVRASVCALLIGRIYPLLPGEQQTVGSGQ
jgi:hypothetical protein